MSQSAVPLPRSPVSVLVPCFNNEAYLEDCLRTLTWADEVVVCDSFSTDSTLEVAARYAHRILQHEYVNSATQKNWAIPQLTHDWVLIVDTDEQVSPDLRRQIAAALTRAHSADCEEQTRTLFPAGFRMPRANHVFGRWLRHGGEWPDWQLRLFRKERGRFENREVHAHVVVEGPVETLDAPILHYPHQSLKSVRAQLLGRYTSWEARQKWNEGVRFHWHQLVVRPAGAFVVRYLLNGGWRDGWQGLFMATVWASYVLITYRKLADLCRTAARVPSHSQ